MRLDQYGNPIYNSNDVFNLLYQGKEEHLSNIFVDSTEDLLQLEKITELQFKKFSPQSLTLNEFDQLNQKQWFMPDDYCPNLVEMLFNMCETQEQIDRVSDELEAFIKHGMMDLLFYLKYLVDTLDENNILWGVGRGSSVASYVLFLIGVHKIDSIKYNLDWQEFLR